MARSLLSAGFVSAVLFSFTGSGQYVQPSNNTLSNDQTNAETQLSLGFAPLPPGKRVYNLAPLTATAGLGQNANSLGPIKFPGTLTLFNATNENHVAGDDIAYVSCDPSSYGNFQDSSDVVRIVGNSLPQAIVLYSLNSVSCNLIGSFTCTTIYTMTSAQDSNFLLNSLTQNSTFGAEIGLNNNNTSHSTNTNNNTATAIAGICILYITSGIIVLLFLIVIVSGAIRAHRNPERYGPRASIRGLPRQSRAKGLARAMLETLPIIKFGDLDLAKPSERAIALEDGISKVQQDVEVTGVAVLEDVMEQTNHGMAGGAEGSGKAGSELSANAVTGEGTSEPVQKAHDGLECSICTEDFHFGEDVRVLPCNHKYHPACIDPWLLNVSGTCPLCRHDLRPIPTATAEGNELPALIPPSEGLEGGIAPTGEGETAMNASHHHSLRISRLLDLTRLRTAPPEERIAALRQLHEQLLREGDAEGVAQPNRPAGLTSRLRDTFRIRTRTEPPAQE